MASTKNGYMKAVGKGDDASVELIWSSDEDCGATGAYRSCQYRSKVL